MAQVHPQPGRCGTRRVNSLIGLLLTLLLVPARVTWAQVGATPAAPAAQAAPPRDPLGRETPRGTVLGFMTAARNGNVETSALYLDTDSKGPAAAELARKLYVVLNRRLPARLNELSDQPEGALDALNPNRNLVGVIDTASGSFDVVVDRIARGKSAPVWLFSRETLASIPGAFEDVNLVAVDRFVPDFLSKPRIFGVRLLAWLVLLIAGPLCYRLLGSLKWVFGPLVALWHWRSGVTDRQAVRHVPGLVRLVILGIAIRWLLVSLEIPLLERQFWTTVATLLLVVATGWFLLQLNGYGERYALRRFATSGDLRSLLRLARRVADVLVLAACGVATLRYFGFDPTAALAGLGIGGIAVALAAQKTLENVIAGVSLIFDRALRVGDAIKFGETVGTVDYIGLRSTRIRTLDRTILTVPNGQIASAGIETLSARDKFWFHHFIGLQYGTTAGQMRSVMEGIRALLFAHANVDAGSVRVRFFRLGSFSLDIEVFSYVFADDWNHFMEVQQALLLGVMDIVEKAGAEIAFPSQTLHLAEAPTPGAARQEAD